MTPEISHRCSSCGASIRDDALFCPECGQAQSKSAEDGAEANPETASRREPVQETGDANAELPNTEDEAAAATLPSQNIAGTQPHRIAGKTRETLHRASAVASAAARGVIEEPAKRVEQIRDASTHVIEEAS